MLGLRRKRQFVDEVVVGNYSNQAEAQMWAELLREEGIPCRIARAGVEVAAVGFDAFVPHDLRVFADDAQRARAVLATPPDE
jgi:hypothetical protein